MKEKFQIEICERPSFCNINLVSTRNVEGVEIPNGIIHIGKFEHDCKPKIETFVSVLAAAFWHLGLDFTHSREVVKGNGNGS